MYQKGDQYIYWTLAPIRMKRWQMELEESFFIAGKSLTEFGDNASNEQLVYFLSIGKDGGTKYRPR